MLVVDNLQFALFHRPLGAAHADEPFAFAAAGGNRAALLPPERLRARVPGIDDAARGKGQSVQRIGLGFVADAQFDGIDAHVGMLRRNASLTPYVKG